MADHLAIKEGAKGNLHFSKPDDNTSIFFLRNTSTLVRLITTTLILCSVLTVFLFSIWDIRIHVPFHYAISLIGSQSTSSSGLKAVNLSSVPPSLSRYVRWHNEMRHCLVDKSCESEQPQVLLWRCPSDNTGACAGVGDRFRGLQFALLLAVFTNRLLFIDWPKDPFPLSEVAAPAGIDWRVPDGISGEAWPEAYWFSCVPPRPCLAAGHLPSDDQLPAPNNSGPDINLASSNISAELSVAPQLAIVTRATESSFTLLHRNTVAIAQFEDLSPNNISDVDLQRNLLQILFQPSDHVMKSLNKVIPSEFRKRGYIAVHARTGYDVGESGGRFQVINDEGQLFAQRMIECAIDSNRDLSKRIFLASDSLVFKDIFGQVAQQYGLEVASSELPGFHFGIRHNSSESFLRDHAWAQYVNVFTDFFGLANANVVITNGSGFARMAFLISNTNEWRTARFDGQKCT